jgi:MtaA/CmuA family methyltransferase
VTGRERVLTALAGQDCDHLALMPITMMFAADTAGVHYGRYAKDFRVLAEAQFRVAEKFDFDYVSAISDPAREASDLGATIEWFDDQPPAIVESRALFADKAALANTRVPDPAAGPRMSDRIRAVELLKQHAGADKAVEGWVEGPCAMAADLRGLNTLMLDFFDDPPFVNELFDFVTEMELRFAKAQIEAGADLIGVGDAAASLIGPKLYREFVLPFERKLVDGLHAMSTRVRLHICGNTRKILADMGTTGADLIDLDSPSPVGEARKAMGSRQVLLGNIDPVRGLKNGTAESVTASVAECHRAGTPHYIVGVGCEIPRDTPDENVRALTRYAKSQR